MPSDAATAFLPYGLKVDNFLCFLCPRAGAGDAADYGQMAGDGQWRLRSDPNQRQ